MESKHTFTMLFVISIGIVTYYRDIFTKEDFKVLQASNYDIKSRYHCIQIINTLTNCSLQTGQLKFK